MTAILTQCIRGGSQEREPGFIIGFNYDRYLVQQLKWAVPHEKREWRPDTQTWWISADYEKILDKMFSNFHALIHQQQQMF